MGEIERGAVLPVAATMLLVLVIAAGRVEARADETPYRAAYLKYCSACHGSEGKGDGVVSHLMRIKPTDLTQIAKEHGGEFPTVHVMQVIDGRKTARAHGDPDMPVWGEVLAAPVGGAVGAEPGARSTVMDITEYLRSIQSQ